MVSFYFRYSPGKHNTDTVRTWLFHYNRAGIPVAVVATAANDFTETFPQGREFLVPTPPAGSIEITENDFLFRFHAGVDDQLVLEWGPGIDLPRMPDRIGRVFSVPVDGKQLGTTFEIPDFILHRHAGHSHFVQWGVGEGGEPSREWVFLSLMISPRACPGEYYENRLLVQTGMYNDVIMKGVNHYDNYLMNVNVNKERGYGIIWHPKAACTTLVSLFGRFVGLNNNPKDRLGINHKMVRFRHNRYLENIQYFEVVRNPYTRFLSTYIDKHVLQRSDPIYPIREEYFRYLSCYPGEDSLMSLCRYLSLGGYISDHFGPMVCPIDAEAERSTVIKVRMEDGLNEEMVRFFGRWHPDRINEISTCFENTIRDGETPTTAVVDPSLKHMNSDQWREYLKHNPISYKAMLDDELRDMCRRHWAADFIMHGYDPEEEIKN